MTDAPSRIIVVDDEPVIRQFMQAALSDMGYAVETYGTCAEGLERCKQLDFDLAMVDKNLPDGNGLEICVALAGTDCKVALVTGYANLNSAVEAMRLGVAEYFIKPVDLDDLEVRIGRMLAELKLERTNRRLLTELAEKCQELERFAARDLVTGLFNHTHFLGQVGVEVTRSADRQCFVLALISLDRFGQVNRLVGHAGGDAVLQKLAALLVPTGPTNPWGPAGGRFLAGRLQGDTFAVLMPEATRNQAAALLQTLRSSVSEESFGSGLPRLTVSIGLAQYPTDGETAGLILDSARRALQEAKACGGDTVLAVQPNSGRDSLTDITRVRALGGCIANRAVRFDYQPIVSLSKGGLLAYEALCRPTGNEFRHIGELLDAAGSAGRLVELGGMLRDVALLPIGDLAQDCLLFLNVNPQELNGDALYQADSALWKHARRVVLEITETDEISDFAAAREQLSRLRAAGFRIALDDFGAGYQGFTSLALLEPDFVKLDMGIVRGITAASPAGRLTRHIREFCADEGIATIAEGVETQAEVDALCELGIDLMQGYYFARPSPPFCAATLPPQQFPAVDVPSLGVAKRLASHS